MVQTTPILGKQEGKRDPLRPLYWRTVLRTAKSRSTQHYRTFGKVSSVAAVIRVVQGSLQNLPDSEGPISLWCDTDISLSGVLGYGLKIEVLPWVEGQGKWGGDFKVCTLDPGDYNMIL